MTTTAETFSQNFRTELVNAGRTVPAHDEVGPSMLTTNWMRLEKPAGVGQPATTFRMIQYRAWTERFIGPLEYQSGHDSRVRVIRLVMEFWNRLADEESEEDVIGPTGQMQDDFDLWGSPEYWRDVFPSDPSDPVAIQRIDPDTEPSFTSENLDGILMHYTISVGLLAVP